MKRVVRIVLLIAFVVCLSTISRAAEVSVNLSPDKQKVEQGSEVKISVSINGFTREGTQKAIEAKLIYDNEKLQYKDINWNDGWTGSISSDGTGLAANKSTQIDENESIAEITYTVKQNATIGNTSIEIQEVLTSSDGDEVTASNNQTSIEIIQPVSGDDNPGGGDGENPGGDNNPNHKVLISIEISTKPSKTAYKEGEKFDKTGMKVIAKYDDGTNNEITNYTFSPNGNLKTTDKEIIISYEEDGVIKTTKLPITVTLANGGVSSNQNGKDNTGSDKDYPYTGVKDFILPIGIALMFVIISYLGYRKYKEI